MQEEVLESPVQKIENYEFGYYAVIPVSILTRKDLKPNCKLLYAEISALAKKSGECKATNKYLGEMLGLSENSITDLLNILKKTGLITIEVEKHSKGTYRTIWLNIGTPPSRTTDTGVPNNGVGAVPNNGYIIDNNKHRDNNKDINYNMKQKVSSVEITDNKKFNELIDLFKEVNPSYQILFGNKTQRSAVGRLIDRLSVEKLIIVIKNLKKTNAEKYAPTITTPVQLEEKLGSLIAFLQKNNNTNNVLIL